LKHLGERGDLFHTHSTYHRGDELLVGAFLWLDLTPKGRSVAFEIRPAQDLAEMIRESRTRRQTAAS